jgi:hypothetical protein
VNPSALLLALCCALAALGCGGPSGPTDPAVQATLGISLPARAPGKVRTVPTELTTAQCEQLGRLDGATDREAGVTPSRIEGDFTVIQEPGKERQVRVSLSRGGVRYLSCAQAYTRAYEAVYPVQ